MGANGVGKTTLLRCLAGITRPDAGELWCCGEKISRNSNANRLLESFSVTRAQRTRMFGKRPTGADHPNRAEARIGCGPAALGMVAHENQLYPNLTLRENLHFAARMYATTQPRQQASDWLERIGLLSYAKCLPHQISHGMRRRVSVARGLIHQPRIVLLDEPFSGLDSEGRSWLAELLADLQKNEQSICFTTHDAAQAQLCADQVLCLKNGRLQETSIVQSPTIKHSLSPRQAA